MTLAALPTAARLKWPWLDRHGAFSPLKAAAFALVLLPAGSMAWDVAAENYGPIPVHGLLYWSGVWATALLLAALAVTPARAILGWNRLIAVRRMIGVAALAYTIFHVFTYFALDSWDFPRVLDEMSAMTLNIIAATVSTIALTALGVTSFDAAIRRLGARGWQRLHRAIYWATALAIVHFLYSRSIFPVVFFFSGALFWLLAWRLLARADRGADPFALSALAGTSAVFTLALEVWWMEAQHHVEPARTLTETLTFGGEITPAWQQVLVLGLAVAATAAFARLSRRPAVS